MASKRSELREKCMVILYQIEIMKKNNINYDIDSLMEDNVMIESEFVKEIVYGVTTHDEEIVDIANEYLINWDISRLDATGRAILKMGIYELLYTDTPQIVAINEAINLAKQYSDNDVRKMINGVLDKVMKKNER